MGTMIAVVLFNNVCLIANVTCRRLAESARTNRRSMLVHVRAVLSGYRTCIHCSLADAASPRQSYSVCAKNGSSSVSAKLEVNHGRRVVTLGVLLPRDAMQARPMPSCGLSVCACVSVCHVRGFCQNE